MKPAVENLLNKKQWHGERKKLRQIILGHRLKEEVKWGKLCYTFEGRNVVIIYGLKAYCAAGFFKGSLLSDDENVLVSPGKHSQAMRQFRFSGLDEIVEREDILARYIANAIEIEKDGLEVDFSEKNGLAYPAELADVFGQDPNFAKAFANLTRGRQRGYVIHFSGAKKSRTRSSRIEKCKPKILEGKGLNER